MTAEVMNAGLPIVAPPASSSMSTTGRGQLPSVSRRNSSGDSSSNVIRRPDVTDDAHLLGLTQGLGTSEDVVASSMSILI